MKILILIKWMVKWNGASKVAYELARQFKKNGHNVIIVTYKGHIDPEWEKEFIFSPLKKSGLFAFFQLRSIIHEYKPDIIHSHDWLGIMTIGSGIPLISTNHSNWPFNWFFSLDTFLAGIFQGIPNELKLYFSNKVIAVSLYQKKMMKKRKIKSELIYNGVNPEEYSTNQETIPEILHPAILFVGTVDNRKARHLKEFIEELNKIESNVHYYIIGPPVDNKLIEDIRKNKNAYYLGIVDNVIPYYLNADVLIFVSRAEMCPLVILEALASRLPVVAFDICSNKELIQNGECGFLVAYKDIKELTKKTSDIIHDKKLKEQLGEKGYHRVIQYFSWEKNAHKYINCFSNITHSNK
jgi:glycosyltransferase involved in cell wall biosynthesis